MAKRSSHRKKLSARERRRRQRERLRRWRAANPEKARLHTERAKGYQRVYYLANKEEVLERQRLYGKKPSVRKRVRAYRVGWREKKRLEIRAYHTRWMNENLESQRKKRKEYREKNGPKIRRAIRKWVRENRERKRQSDRAYQVANLEKIREQAKRRRLANPVQFKAERARYRKLNRFKISVWQQNRAARKVGSGQVSEAECRELLEQYGYRCRYCRVDGKLTWDHVIPIREGGPHRKWNLVPACGSCNQSKGKRDWPNGVPREVDAIRLLRLVRAAEGADDGHANYRDQEQEEAGPVAARQADHRL